MAAPGGRGTWPVVGHEWAVDLLAQSIQARKLSHAYLITGPGQVGKGTLARAFVQAILCTAREVPCGTCRSCQLVHDGRHPDVLVVEPEDNRIKIEAIRDMQRSVALSPVEARYRVCLVDHVDRATTAAANSLLKTLEEPPTTVILVLTADQLGSVLPTIVSRCQVLSLRLLPTAQIVSNLRSRGVDDARSHLLAHLAQGRIGWAIAASEDPRLLDSRNEWLQDLVELDGDGYSARFAWAHQLSKKPDRVPDVLNVLGSWWRDVLLLASGSQTPITNLDNQSHLHEWATRYGVAAAKHALDAVRSTAWRVDHNANLRLALEVLMLDLPGGSRAP